MRKLKGGRRLIYNSQLGHDRITKGSMQESTAMFQGSTSKSGYEIIEIDDWNWRCSLWNFSVVLMKMWIFWKFQNFKIPSVSKFLFCMDSFPNRGWLFWGKGVRSKHDGVKWRIIEKIAENRKNPTRKKGAKMKQKKSTSAICLFYISFKLK